MKKKVWRENGFLYTEKVAAQTCHVYIVWFFVAFAVGWAINNDLLANAIVVACMYVCWKQAAKYSRIEKAIREANKEG